MHELKLYRITNDISQAELAKAMNVTQGLVSHMEVGRIECDQDKTEKFKNAIDKLVKKRNAIKTK
jgi:predicted transcriptional regulator